MFLVELVLQGVRGLREPARLRFKGGYNLVIAGNESGKTSAIDTMQRLLFPTSQAGALTSLVSRHSPDTSRSALVLYSDDGVYRRGLLTDICVSACAPCGPTGNIVISRNASTGVEYTGAVRGGEILRRSGKACRTS
jgi:hypothetical protein